MTHFLLPAFTLIRREWIRFWRERARVAGFVAAPLLFWFVTSSGFGDFARFFTGSLTLTLMFSAVFANMTLIEDRREGFLLAMLVSPAPRASLVAGKVIGAASLAWAQGAIVLAFAPLAGFTPPLANFLLALAALFLVAVAFTALGFLAAWITQSTQGFHAIMNILLMPMWMVSGALFPMKTAIGWMRLLMQINPLAYAYALLERLLNTHADPLLPSLGLSLAVTAVFATLLLIAAHRIAAD